MTDIAKLMEQVLSSPGDKTLLAEVRARAGEIFEHLDREESLEDWKWRTFEADPAWLAAVLEALAGDQAPPKEDAPILEALFQAGAARESGIGYAFKEGLLAGLPKHLTNLAHWFRQVPLIDPVDQANLLRTPAVEAARLASEALVPHGVTPLTVFYATEAVSGLAGRLRRLGAIAEDESFVLDPSGTQPVTQDGSVTNDTVLREIRFVAECSPPAASVLYPWLVAAAQFKPFVFRGYEAGPLKTAVRLNRVKDDQPELYVRWGLPADARGERELAYT